MTAQLSREELQRIAETDHVQCGDAAAMARMLLAGMDSEPVAYMIGGHYLMHAHDPKVDNYASAVPLYTAPLAPVAVPDEAAVGEMSFLGSGEASYVRGWNDCRAAMLKHQSSIASSSGAGCSVGIKQPSSNEPVTGWIKCSERMPPSKNPVIVGCWFGRNWATKWATYLPGHEDAQKSGFLMPGGSWTPTHWMPIPAAPVPAAKVPDGWKLVPVEPTKEMIDAGWSYYMTTKSPSSLGVYGAMLAAAPDQEV